MTVVQVAYPFARVGPGAVGGAEQVVWALDRALVEAGHRSIVIATEGSEVAGELLPVRLPDEVLTDALRGEVRGWTRAMVALAVDRFCPDLVHLHGVDFAAYLPPPGVPALVTLHLPASFYEELCPDRLDTWLHAVSRSHHAALPDGLALLSPIDNGVSVDALEIRCSKRAFALYLGRICPEKNLAAALDAGAAAGLPVVVAGRVHPYEAHLRYFDDEIAPRLAGHRFVGPVGFERKRRLLGMARCLLIPSRVDETSSLAAMEALAAGTPVVGLAKGALPEIVEDGATGFLVRDESELPDAIARAASLDPEDCRRAARERFRIERTTARYLARYEALASPLTVDVRSDLQVEGWGELWTSIPSASSFAGPEWLVPWWEAWGEGELVVIEVRARGRLVGLLPLYRSETEPGTLLPVGISTSDVLGGLFAPDHAPRAAERALAALGDVPGWSRCELSQLPPDSPLVGGRTPHAGEVGEGEATQVLTLGSSLEDCVPRRMFRKLRGYRARVDGACALATEETFEEVFGALVRLHRKRWGGVGVLDDRAVRALTGAGSALLRAGRLRLWGMRVEGRVGSVVLGFAEARRTCLYLSGYDPDLEDRNVGTVLLGAAIEHAIAEGHAEVDLLRGGEPYKRLWGALPRPTFRRVLVR